MFGRAVADDKGPIVMLLAALRSLREAGTQPSVNLKLLLDSEEEKGSPSIAARAGARGARCCAPTRW